MSVHRLLSMLVMVGAVLAVTLPPLVPEPWQLGAAVLAFLLGVLASLRFRGAGGRAALVFLGMGILALAFAVPAGAWLGGGLAGAAAVILVNAWTWKPGEGKGGA